MESEPPYQYVWSNPINYIDPAGLQPPPCTGDPTQICITQPVGPGTSEYPPQPSPPAPPPSPPPTPSAWLDPYVASECSKFHFKAPGYVEGYATVRAMVILVEDFEGEEVVFNFATLERATYKFELSSNLSGVTTPELSVANISYYVNLRGFDNDQNMNQEYSGAFLGFSAGAGLSIPPIPVSGGGGKTFVYSPLVWGTGEYILASGGLSAIPVSLSFSETYYNPITIQSYVPEGMNVEDKHIDRMKVDIQSGQYSPSTQLVNPKQRDDAIDQLQKVYDAHKYFFNAHYNEFRDKYRYGKY